MEMVVLLPAPLGPRRLKISPSAMSKLTPSTASTPLGGSYCLRSSLTSTMLTARPPRRLLRPSLVIHLRAGGGHALKLLGDRPSASGVWYRPSVRASRITRRASAAREGEPCAGHAAICSSSSWGSRSRCSPERLTQGRRPLPRPVRTAPRRPASGSCRGRLWSGSTGRLRRRHEAAGARARRPRHEVPAAGAGRRPHRGGPLGLALDGRAGRRAGGRSPGRPRRAGLPPASRGDAQRPGPSGSVGHAADPGAARLGPDDGVPVGRAGERRHRRGLHAPRPRRQHVAQPGRDRGQRARRRRERLRRRRLRHRRGVRRGRPVRPHGRAGSRDAHGRDDGRGGRQRHGRDRRRLAGEHHGPPLLQRRRRWAPPPTPSTASTTRSR